VEHKSCFVYLFIIIIIIIIVVVVVFFYFFYVTSFSKNGCPPRFSEHLFVTQKMYICVYFGFRTGNSEVSIISDVRTLIFQWVTTHSRPAKSSGKHYLLRRGDFALRSQDLRFITWRRLRFVAYLWISKHKYSIHIILRKEKHVISYLTFPVSHPFCITFKKKEEGEIINASHISTLEAWPVAPHHPVLIRFSLVLY